MTKRKDDHGGGSRAGRKMLAGLVCMSLLLQAIWGSAAENEKKGDPTVLDEITVVGTPDTKPVTPQNTRYGTQHNLVTEEQIKEQNSLDFQSTLRDVPGVMFQSKNMVGSQTSHSIYIRGRGSSHPSSDFSIEFDGAPRYGALFGQVMGDGISVSTIGGVEVFKSPQLSQFGSGYASISIQPKYLKEEGHELVLDAGGGTFATVNQSLSGGLKKGPFDFYLSQSWTSTDGNQDHSRAQQQNYYANLGYQLNKAWNVRLLFNHVDSQTLAPMPDKTPTATNGVSWPGAERYDTSTDFMTLTLNHNYDKAQGYIKAYWNDTTFDLLQELTNGKRYGNGSGGLNSRQDISLYGVRMKEKLHLWPGGEILMGADLDRSELKNTERTYSGLAAAGVNGGRAERIWNFPGTTIISPHIAVSQLIGSNEGFHVIPSAGYRYYSHNEFRDKSASHAGLVMGYGHTDLTMNYSRGVNYPSPVVLMNMTLTSSPVNNADQYWKNIRPEVVDHYEIGLSHTWPGIASLSATGFYDRGKDRYQAYMYGPIPTQFNDTIGHYTIRGLELSGKVTPVKKLELFAGATWLKAKATGSNGVESDHMPYTPGLQIQAGATWDFLENFRLFTDIQHLRNLYQGTSMRAGSFNFTPLTSKDKLDDITLVNAKLSYHFTYKPLHLNDSEIYVAVNNLFNQRYEYAKGYEMPGITAFAGFSMKLR